MKNGGVKRIILISFLGLALLAGLFSAAFLQARNSDPVYGATFSYLYAQQFDYDWKEAYIAILDDLGLEAIRIPIYWSEVERSDDVYDFEALDWMMNEASARSVDVTLVVGQKVPRWPECYIPDWAEYGSNAERAEQLLDFVKVSVQRYENHPALVRWQVENESFFPFGECPDPDPSLIEQEIALVRAFDPNHPIQLTTSGEQAFWVARAIPADVLGVSLYRVVQDEFFGVLIFPHTSEMYAIQRVFADMFAQEVIISELQVEPWGIAGKRIGEGYGISAAYDLFTEKDLEYHMDFAKQTGVSEIFLWGVEWWYYLDVNGDSRLWDAGAKYIQEEYEAED
jgi:hypothetical protein